MSLEAASRGSIGSAPVRTKAACVAGMAPQSSAMTLTRSEDLAQVTRLSERQIPHPIAPQRLAEKRACGDHFFSTVLKEGVLLATEN